MSLLSIGKYMKWTFCHTCNQQRCIQIMIFFCKSCRLFYEFASHCKLHWVSSARYRNIMHHCSVTQVRSCTAPHYLSLCSSRRPIKSPSPLPSASGQQPTSRVLLPSSDSIGEYLPFCCVRISDTNKTTTVGKTRQVQVHGVVFLSFLIAWSLCDVLSGGKQRWDAVRAAVCSCHCVGCEW